MEWKGKKFCDWCQKGFWDKHGLGKVIKVGNKLLYCSENCKENHEYMMKK